MIIRGNDDDGDWIFGIGKNAYKKEDAAIAQNIATKIQEWKGDCFFNNEAGIDWINRIGTSDIKRLEADLRKLIIKCDGVISLTRLSLDFVDRAFSVSYEVQTIFSASLINSIKSNG